MEERAFTSEDYRKVTASLDAAMKAFKDLGKSEDAARTALESFMCSHYFPVWRGMGSDR